MADQTPPSSGKKPDTRRWRTQTKLVRGGMKRSQYGETSEGLFLTSGFVYPTAESAETTFKGENERFIYSRFSNPTVGMFEERIALLEGASVARATASGMSAVFASLACIVRAGDRVVASRALFGGCHYVITEILPRYGVTVELVDGTKADQWEKALAKPVRAVFLESPSNPGLEIIDIAHVAALTHKAGGLLIVDNVFASPVLQKPLTLGADIVVYSATKHIDGQGRLLGGAIIGNDPQYMNDHLRLFLRHTGPTLSAFNAWVLIKGLETLDLRLRQHCENATRVARYLEGRGDIDHLLFPGLKSHPQYALAQKQMSGPGNIVGFTVPGGKDGAFRFMNALTLIDISNNLGDTKSLVTHPTTTTHQRLTEEDRLTLGITPGYVRLSVGLEDVDDIIEDLDQALAAAKRG